MELEKETNWYRVLRVNLCTLRIRIVALFSGPIYAKNDLVVLVKKRQINYVPSVKLNKDSG